MEFGEKIKQLRQEQNLTQEELAEKLYVTRQAVSRWECGARFPDLHMAKKIATIFDVTLDELLSGEEVQKNIEKRPVLESPRDNVVEIILYTVSCVAFLLMLIFDIYQCLPPFYASAERIVMTVIAAGDVVIVGTGLVLSIRKKLKARVLAVIMSAPYFMNLISAIICAIVMPMHTIYIWKVLVSILLYSFFAILIAFYFGSAKRKVPFWGIAGIGIIAILYDIREIMYIPVGISFYELFVGIVYYLGNITLVALLVYQAFVWKEKKRLAVQLAEESDDSVSGKFDGRVSEKTTLSRHVTICKKRTGLSIATAVTAFLVIAVWLVFNIKSGADYTEELSTLSADAFTDSTWENDVVWGDGQLLSGGGDSRVWYTNMETGHSMLLCKDEKCKHNTPECNADFAFGMADIFTYVYQGQIYVGSESASGEIRVTRGNMDGSEKEIVDSMGFAEHTSCSDVLIDDGVVYIAMILSDTSNRRILNEEGDASDSPGTAKIIKFEFATGKFEEIYHFTDSCYQYFITFRYLDGEKLYFDRQWQDIPYEEMYDINNGEELENHNGKEYAEVECLNMKTGELEVLPDYEFGGYIGSQGPIRYFAGNGDCELFNGRIHVEEKQGDDMIKREILLEDFEEEERRTYYSLRRISDGFVLNEDDENEANGRITFYDNEGKKRFQVKNAKKFVIGERDGYYMLGGNSISTAAGYYISKEDIKELNQKKVRIGEE